MRQVQVQPQQTIIYNSNNNLNTSQNSSNSNVLVDVVDIGGGGELQNNNFNITQKNEEKLLALKIDFSNTVESFYNKYFKNFPQQIEKINLTKVLHEFQQDKSMLKNQCNILQSSMKDDNSLDSDSDTEIRHIILNFCSKDMYVPIKTSWNNGNINITDLHFTTLLDFLEIEYQKKQDGDTVSVQIGQSSLVGINAKSALLAVREMVLQSKFKYRAASIEQNKGTIEIDDNEKKIATENTKSKNPLLAAIDNLIAFVGTNTS